MSNVTKQQTARRHAEDSSENRRVPSLRHHKATGQAYAVLNGKAVYFGRTDDPQAEQKYHQAIAEWLAAGKQLPVDRADISARPVFVHPRAATLVSAGILTQGSPSAIDDSNTRQALGRAGAFIRRRAKSSIRRRKGISQPGQPPHSHAGHLKRLIFFSWDMACYLPATAQPARPGPGKRLLSRRAVPRISRESRRLRSRIHSGNVG